VFLTYKKHQTEGGTKLNRHLATHFIQNVITLSRQYRRIFCLAAQAVADTDMPASAPHTPER